MAVEAFAVTSFYRKRLCMHVLCATQIMTNQTHCNGGVGITINQDKATKCFALVEGFKGDCFAGADITSGNIVELKCCASLVTKVVDVDAVLYIGD